MQDARLTALPGFDGAAAAWQVALEFLTGYIVEKSLSVDNIFVFVVVFSYFAIPARYQHRVLFYGIIGAVIVASIALSLFFPKKLGESEKPTLNPTSPSNSRELESVEPPEIRSLPR